MLQERKATMQAARVARLDVEAARQEAGMDRETARKETVLLRSHDGIVVSWERRFCSVMAEMSGETLSYIGYLFYCCCCSHSFCFVKTFGLKWMLDHAMHVPVISFSFSSLQ